MAPKIKPLKALGRVADRVSLAQGDFIAWMCVATLVGFQFGQVASERCWRLFVF